MNFCFDLRVFCCCCCFVCDLVCMCHDVHTQVRTTYESHFSPTVQVREMEIRSPGWRQSTFNLFTRLSHLQSQSFVSRPPSTPFSCLSAESPSLLSHGHVVWEPPCPLASFRSIKTWQYHLSGVIPSEVLVKTLSPLPAWQPDTGGPRKLQAQPAGNQHVRCPWVLAMNHFKREKVETRRV